MPVFDDWAKSQNEEDKANPTRITVNLDLGKSIAEFLLWHTGEVSGRLIVAREFYSASIPLTGIMVGSDILKSVEMSINRYTGAALMRYARKSDGSMLIAFSGSCTRGEPLF